MPDQITFHFRFNEDSQNCVEPEEAQCPDTTKICDGVEDETFIGSDT